MGVVNRAGRMEVVGGWDWRGANTHGLTRSESLLFLLSFICSHDDGGGRSIPLLKRKNRKRKRDNTQFEIQSALRLHAGTVSITKKKQLLLLEEREMESFNFENWRVAFFLFLKNRELLGFGSIRPILKGQQLQWKSTHWLQKKKRTKFFFLFYWFHSVLPIFLLSGNGEYVNTRCHHQISWSSSLAHTTGPGSTVDDTIVYV